MIYDATGKVVALERVRRAVGFVEAYVRDEPQDTLNASGPVPLEDCWVPSVAKHWYECRKRGPL